MVSKQGRTSRARRDARVTIGSLACTTVILGSGGIVWYNHRMTADDFGRRLDALISRTSFHPFGIELLGGRRFEVDHARAMVTRDGVAVYIAPGGVPIWFDHEGVASIVGDAADAA